MLQRDDREDRVYIVVTWKLVGAGVEIYEAARDCFVWEERSKTEAVVNDGTARLSLKAKAWGRVWLTHHVTQMTSGDLRILRHEEMH